MLAQIEQSDPWAIALVVALVVVMLAAGYAWRRVRAMGRQHEQALRTLMHRHSHVEATLSSMLDGVIAVDRQGQIISINDAARSLLRSRSGRGAGEHFQRAIENPQLRPFIERAIAHDRPIQSEIAVDDRRYQVHGTVLRGGEGDRLGSLIVLHDVTRLRRLEQVRRDFVANASHEIKTPVTAIKAAAETIMDANGHDPDASRHFLGVIERQAERLSALVEDLLSIARLEADAEGPRIPTEIKPLRPVLTGALETCRGAIEARSAHVEITCQPDLAAPIKPDLLEQAVVNLIDNAVKYSDEGSSVQVTAERLAGEVVIAIYDRGIGIAPEHLPRIFERFYRTDRARSRQLGGTGLGLAIVKHIANAHGGRVTVDSTPGHGSTFRLHLPAG